MFHGPRGHDSLTPSDGHCSHEPLDSSGRLLSGALLLSVLGTLLSPFFVSRHQGLTFLAGSFPRAAEASPTTPRVTPGAASLCPRLCRQHALLRCWGGGCQWCPCWALPANSVGIGISPPILFFLKILNKESFIILHN